MSHFRQLLEKRTAVWWWVVALSLFVGSTFVIVLIDFVGDRWFGVSWELGPDLFPNTVLGPILAGFQLISACLLLLAGVRFAITRRSWTGVILATIGVGATASVCLIGYFLFAFWYQLDVVKRGL